MDADASPDAEHWGHCDVCVRWFYCGHGPILSDPPSCPVCAIPASLVEQRIQARA